MNKRMNKWMIEFINKWTIELNQINEQTNKQIKNEKIWNASFHFVLIKDKKKKEGKIHSSWAYS